MKRSLVVRLVSLLALTGWSGGGFLLAQQASPASVPNPGAVSPALLQPGDGVATLRTRARLVLLDVVVTNGKGKPVQGLKASDFTLLEDGVPQVLSSFQEHTPITAEEVAKAAAAVKLPANHFTNYDPVPNESAATVFLLDALDTPIQAQMYLRDQMIAYMKTVPAGTKIAIFQLDTQLRMIQGFTSDQEVLRQVVSSKRNQPESSPLLGGPMSPGYVRERIRLDILTQAMQGLARYLGPFPGRKNLIWFTGRVPIPLYGPGFNVPFPDMTSFIDDFSKTTDVLTLSRIAVYPVDSRGLETNLAFSAANGVGDPRGSELREFSSRQFYQHGDLDDVAEATGGRAFYNTNGLKDAIAEVVDTGSNYYTLSYNPSNHDWDGGYRKLQVKLAEEGLHLEYRRGYYARNDEVAESRHMAQLQNSRRRVLPVPADGKTPSPRLDAAMKMGAAAPKDIIFLANVMPVAAVSKAKGEEPLPKDNFLDKRYRRSEYRDYQIHYSVNAQTLQLMPTPELNYHGHLEIVAVVYDDMGQVVNSKSSQVPIDVDSTEYQQMLRGGLGVDQSIAIPVKGNFFLRMGVYDVSGNKLGALEVPVDQIKLGLAQSAAVVKP
jgi:VWFA-related protein